MDTPDLNRDRAALLQRITIVLRTHKFDIDGSLAENYAWFRDWLRSYRAMPDEETLTAKLLESGLVKEPQTVAYLIREMAERRSAEMTDNYGAEASAVMQIITDEIKAQRLDISTHALAALRSWTENPPPDLNWGKLKERLLSIGFSENSTLAVFQSLRHASTVTGKISSAWIRLNGNGNDHRPTDTVRVQREVPPTSPRPTIVDESVIQITESGPRDEPASETKRVWVLPAWLAFARSRTADVKWGLIGFWLVVIVLGGLLIVMGLTRGAQMAADAPMVTIVILGLSLLALVGYAVWCSVKAKFVANDGYSPGRRLERTRERQKLALIGTVIVAVPFLILVAKKPVEIRKLGYLVKANYLVATGQDDMLPSAIMETVQQTATAADNAKKQAEATRSAAEASRQSLKLQVSEAESFLDQAARNLSEVQELRQQEAQLNQQIEGLRNQAAAMGLLGTSGVKSSETALEEERKTVQTMQDQRDRLQNLIDKAKLAKNGQPLPPSSSQTPAATVPPTATTTRGVSPPAKPNNVIVLEGRSSEPLILQPNKPLEKAVETQAATEKVLAEENAKLRAEIARSKRHPPSKTKAHLTRRTKPAPVATAAKSANSVAVEPSAQLKALLKKTGGR